MAITPKICIQYEADASQITITDNTGVYDPNNEGGYGAPNSDRSSVAGVLLVSYQGYEEDKKIISNLDDIVRYDVNYLNTEKSQFIVPYFKDGWYEFLYVLIPTSIDPVEGRIIYDTINEELRQYNSDLDLVPVYDITLLDNPAIYPLVKENEIPVVKLKIKKNQLARDYFSCKQCVECDCEDEFNEVLYLREGIQSLIAYFTVSPFEAQRTVERLTKQYKIK